MRSRKSCGDDVTHQFEDPRKSVMRESCLIAIDAAGYELIDEPVPIAPPAGMGLNGNIIGDVQSRDGSGRVAAYYLRPVGDKPLPKWLVNFSRAAQELGSVDVFAVVTETSAIIEQTSRAGGAGLLRITEDNTFDLIVDPAEFGAGAQATALKDRLTTCRRDLDSKLALNLEHIQNNFDRVQQGTIGMSGEKRDEYIQSVEDSDAALRSWAENLSSRLDTIEATQDEDELRSVERWISEGPFPEDD
jgi:hypothetical protein